MDDEALEQEKTDVPESQRILLQASLRVDELGSELRDQLAQLQGLDNEPRSSGHAELMERAKTIQKRNKQKNTRKDEKVLVCERYYLSRKSCEINVSLMKRTDEGYRKFGPYVSLSLAKTSTKDDVIEQSVQALAKELKIQGRTAIGDTVKQLILPRKGAVLEENWSLGKHVTSLKKSKGHVPTLGVYIRDGAQPGQKKPIVELDCVSDDSEVDFEEPLSKRSKNLHLGKDSHISEQQAQQRQSTGTSSDSQYISQTKPSISQCKSQDVSLKNSQDVSLKDTNLKVFDLHFDGMTDEDIIGKGGFGIVYRMVVHGTQVAVKKMTAVQFAETTFEAEIKTLSRCRHPNIVPIMGYSLRPMSIIYAFMDNGSLSDHLHKRKNALPSKQRMSILLDVVRALNFMHGTGYVHRDIKSTNILLDRNMVGYIGDFGLTVPMPELVPGHTMVTSTTVFQSQGYSASEVYERRFSPKSDVYSFGIVILEVFTGLPAYSESRENRKLTEHCEDNLSEFESFRTIGDTRIRWSRTKVNQEDTILCLYETIRKCLKRHSVRATSNEVAEVFKKYGFDL